MSRPFEFRIRDFQLAANGINILWMQAEVVNNVNDGCRKYVDRSEPDCHQLVNDALRGPRALPRGCLDNPLDAVCLCGRVDG
jgi:uncharacterized cysteine cluster protein YcgN (CxxCxxCC family)